MRWWMYYISIARPLGRGSIWINHLYIFDKGVSGDIRENNMNFLRVHSDIEWKIPRHATDVGSSTTEAFKYLKYRVWKKFHGWMEQSLLASGKEVLIKTVAQAVPTFSISCFRLPRGLCQHIDGLLWGFWWGSKEGKRKTCWVARKVMTKPKHMGGLGFREIELNLALIAR